MMEPDSHATGPGAPASPIATPQTWRYRAWDVLFNHSPLPSFLSFDVHLRWSKWTLRHLDKHYRQSPLPPEEARDGR